MTNPRDRFDYIVVGAGSAGCILAARLAADGETRVLLIEAGGSDRHWTVQMPGGVRSHYRPGSRFNWHFSSVPQRHLDGREIYQPRGRGLGGSSSINGMVYLRGHPLDYQRWVLEGAAGWSYAEVLPYFKRLERFEPGADTYRGGDGPVGVRRQIDLDPLSAAFLEAGRQAGFPVTDDVNGHRQEGFCRFDMNVDGGVRASTAQAYLHNAPRCANPTIRTGVLVQRVIVDGPRAVAVEFGRQDRVETAHAEREVIVAAGAFGSPQLLMLSGVGPADHLRAHGIDVHTDLPGVGGNLHDHLEVHVQRRCREPVSLNRYLRLDRKLRVGVQWFLFKSGVTARNQPNTGAFLCGNDGVDHPNVQFHFFPAFFGGDWIVRADQQGYRLGTGTMRGASRGTLRLASADAAAAPLIDPNYLATEVDRVELREAFRLARETLAQPAFTRFDAGEADPGPEVRTDAEIDAYIRQASGSAYHPCGTCRMGGEGDTGAVVDSQGRVRGLEGLRVVDASIMPSIVSSNLNCVVMMMAEKLSDAILGRLPLEPIDADFAARAAVMEIEHVANR